MSVDKKQEDIDISGLSSVLPSITSGLNAEDRAGLVNALKNKLQSLAGQRTDVTETLSPRVKKRVDVLRDIQGQHDEFEAKFQEERASLEAKYQKLYEPLYTRRYEIVNGLVEVGVVDESAESNDSESEGKGVPDFWLTAMKTNDVLSEQIQERDEDVLKYLRDIKSLKLVDAKGFKLEFFFCPNSYFKNSVLSKTYHMIDDDDPILEKAVGTEIEWFPGKCLTQKILRKKPKKGSKSTKLITKTEICESFFNFFSPPCLPDDDEELDEDSAEQLQDQMEQDYDVGTAIRDKLIPHAVSWFTGEAAEEDEDAGDEENDEGDDEDDDDDDDDDDEEDEEDEEEEVKPTKKQQPAVHKKAGEADRPPECKQQ